MMTLLFLGAIIIFYVIATNFLSKSGSTAKRQYSQQSTNQNRINDNDEDSFITKIAGATFKNDDGTDRQKILKKCRKGESLKLIRDYNNPHSKYAIKVCRETGEQIGHIAEHVAFCFDNDSRSLAQNIDFGQTVRAEINEIDSFYDGKTIYSCTIKVTKGDYPECFSRVMEAKLLIMNAKQIEDKDVERSINYYRQAMELLKMINIEFEKINDKLKPLNLDYRAWSGVKYPINRLSLLLEKSKRYKECLELIEQYNQLKDITGLPKTDLEIITKRKTRIEKKL
jgi:hypothetical protein